MKRAILKIAGYTAVSLAFAGAFLPLLPTTPFLLVALWCFSKSSPHMQRWMLSNRFFGRYLNDYRAGRGIPVSVKITALSILWGTILLTTILWIEPWWLRVGLWLMALLVSGHILKLPNRPRRANMLILVPTEHESIGIREQLPEIPVAIIGIGPAKSSYHTLNLIRTLRPKRVMLAGIAGAYDTAECPVGTSVVVGSEQCADGGSFEAGVFVPKFRERYLCPYLEGVSSLPIVASNTLSAGGAPFVSRSGVQIENMEGAAFFYVCLQEKIPFWELRTISNRVGDPFEQWDLQSATLQLGKDVKKLTDELNA